MRAHLATAFEAPQYCNMSRTYIPTEVLSIIASALTPADLRQLRATDKRLKDVAEPGAFRRVTITNTFKSINGFMQLLNVDGLCELVERVEFLERPRAAEAEAVRFGTFYAAWSISLS